MPKKKKTKFGRQQGTKKLSTIDEEENMKKEVEGVDETIQDSYVKKMKDIVKCLPCNKKLKSEMKQKLDMYRGQFTNYIEFQRMEEDDEEDWYSSLYSLSVKIYNYYYNKEILKDISE